jgi:hypothetical protein
VSSLTSASGMRKVFRGAVCCTTMCCHVLITLFCCCLTLGCVPITLLDAQGRTHNAVLGANNASV